MEEEPVEVLGANGVGDDRVDLLRGANSAKEVRPVLMPGPACARASEHPEYVVFRHSLVACHRPDDTVQSTDPKVPMVRNGYPMAGRQIRLEYQVAPAFMHKPVPELSNEHVDQGAAAQVPRDLHAGVSSSSRTRWSRMARGEGLSK